MAPRPANPRDESQDSLRGDLIGVSASGVSKLPSESELPRGKNEELPLSTVFPTPFTVYMLTKAEVQHFCLTLQPTRPQQGLACGSSPQGFVAGPSSAFCLPTCLPAIPPSSGAFLHHHLFLRSSFLLISPQKRFSTDSFSNKNLFS